MDKQEVFKALKELREKSPKRNFSQSLDLHMNFKYLDLKKPEHKIDLFMQLPHGIGKKLKLAAFVDQQMFKQAKELFDTVILKEDFARWNNAKKEQKKLAASHDYFVSQVEVMAPLAATFGKILGARGKMPNPKAGCVIPGTASLEPIVKRLQNSIRLQTKNETTVKASVGNDKMSDEDLADNVLAVYNTVLSKLPQEKNNIKFVAIKFTMSPLYKFGQGIKVAQENKKVETKKESVKEVDTEASKEPVKEVKKESKKNGKQKA